jgi:hypothetical protein
MADGKKKKSGAAWRKHAAIKLGRKPDEKSDDTTRASTSDAFRDSWEPSRSVVELDSRRL